MSSSNAIPDILTEEPISLSVAARQLPGNPAPVSLWRWCRKGVNGVRLGYIRIGRKILTSKPALSRFTAALAAADNVLAGEPESPLKEISRMTSRSNKDRQKAIEAAEKRLQ